MVGGHATVGRLSNNVFWTFQAIRNFFEKSRWTVTRQWSEVTRLSADCQAHICMYIIINERERERGERDRILRCIWTANRWRRGIWNADLFEVKCWPAWCFPRRVIGGSNIETLEVWSNADLHNEMIGIRMLTCTMECSRILHRMLTCSTLNADLLDVFRGGNWR